METTQSKLDVLTVASPCTVPWDSMKGGNRIRFCSQCRLNVYNVVEMSRGEAEALIEKTEGRLCVRLFHREDGTVVTADCSLREKIQRKFATRFWKLLMILGIGAALSTQTGCEEPRGVRSVIRSILSIFTDTERETEHSRGIVGIAPPPPPPDVQED